MTNHHQIARVATLALATAAIAAPTASAKFSQTQGAPAISGATPVSSVAVSPSSDVLSTGGYDFARVPATVRTSSDVLSTRGYDLARVPAAGTVTYLAATNNNGFDWGDAGIGAGIAVAIVALLGGTLLVVRRHPQPRISKLT